MDNTYLFIFLIIGIFAFWIILNYLKAKSVQGTPAPDVSIIEGDHKHSSKVLFFHATGCSPCKAIMPLINELETDYPNLYSLDIAQHTELAKKFRLAGTPTLIAIKDDMITGVQLGSTNESWIRKNLEA